MTTTLHAKEVHATRRVESRAIYFGELSAVAAAIVAVAVFWGHVTALFGSGSIGSLASLLGALAAFAGFLVSWEASRPRGEGARHGWAHSVLTSGALAFCHAAIALLLTVIIFYLAQDAFEGVSLDYWTSAGLVGVMVGICGYGAYLAGARMTSLRLSTTLAVFLASGVMASMITAPNPYWWQIHFSSLGGGNSASAAAFNLTLAAGGLVVVGLADLVAGELARWQTARHAIGRVKVNLVRLGLACLGVLLACVGIFAYDTHLLIHNLVAGLMVVVFLVLAASMPRLAPGFGQAFYTLSYMMCGAVIACMWLFLGVGYLNLTAAELVIAGIIFAWLIIFVRQIAAGLDDSGGAAQRAIW